MGSWSRLLLLLAASCSVPAVPSAGPGIGGAPFRDVVAIVFQGGRICDRSTIDSVLAGLGKARPGALNIGIARTAYELERADGSTLVYASTGKFWEVRGPDGVAFWGTVLTDVPLPVPPPEPPPLSPDEIERLLRDPQVGPAEAIEVGPRARAAARR